MPRAVLLGVALPRLVAARLRTRGHRRVPATEPCMAAPLHLLVAASGLHDSTRNAVFGRRDPGYPEPSKDRLQRGMLPSICLLPSILAVWRDRPWAGRSR